MNEAQRRWFAANADRERARKARYRREHRERINSLRRDKRDGALFTIVIGRCERCRCIFAGVNGQAARRRHCSKRCKWATNTRKWGSANVVEHRRHVAVYYERNRQSVLNRLRRNKLDRALRQCGDDSLWRAARAAIFDFVSWQRTAGAS